VVGGQPLNGEAILGHWGWQNGVCEATHGFANLF